MKIYLLDRRAEMEDCWNAYFSGEADVSVVCEDLGISFLETKSIVLFLRQIRMV